MKEKLIIVGISSSAKQVLDFLRVHELFEILGFAVDKEYIKSDKYEGYPVYAIEELRSLFDMEEVKLFVAIGWNRLNADRRDMYNRLKKDGYKFANLISPTAIIRGRIEGDNCWVNDYTIMQSDSVIKSNVVVREQVLIGNDTVINEHCFIGVKSMVAGGCTIGEQTFCGINSTVFDGTTVGKKCIIEACAAAKRNVPDNTVCKLNSDSTITKTYDGEIIESKLLFRANVR